MSEQDRLVAGRYRLRERIGGGGMGAVWRARDERLGREVAVKQVLPSSSADDEAARQQRERALREGRIAARLSHPHAISVYDVALEDDQPWLVMEYLPSRSLSAVLAEDGVLRVDQVAQIGAQVADALAATHEAGIVHRDVKPANILIGQRGRVEGVVKITDFGISHARGDVTLTQTGQITGTPAYLAPEVARGAEPGPPADVFSLGATLYTCLEGEPPFGMAGNSLQQLHRVAAGVIDPPRRSGALTRPLLRMLSTDPAARPSMTEVRDELAALAAGRDGDPTTVLTARTDVASSHRDATSQFAADPAGPPPPRRVEPPAAVAAPRPRRRADPAAGPQPRRRVPRTAWGVGAVVAALAGAILFATLALDDPGGTTAAPDAGASEPGGPTTGDITGGRPGPTGEDDGAVGGQPGESADGGAGGRGGGGQSGGDGDGGGGGEGEGDGGGDGDTADGDDSGGTVIATDDVQVFLDEYHDLVLTDPAAAYRHTGPSLRGVIGLEGFREFWSQYDEVEIDDVRVEDGGTTALARMEFGYPDGTRQTERHRFTFIEEDGRLVLDRDEFIEVLEGRS